MGEETLFTDPTFNGDAAIGSCDVQGWRRPFKWIRAKQLHKNAKLFSVIEADNIKQGELGDCWLLAALADVPNLSENGRLVVKLYDLKYGWVDIEIDDLIPCDKHGTPLFAQLEGESGCLWALLLEKAFAKFVGSYEGLIGGSTPWAWQVLTGQPWMARWTREKGTWTRWEMCDIGDCFSKDEEKSQVAAKKWRTNGMRRGRWRGPSETADDESMFQAMASYTQAGFAISCSIGEGDKAEERRPDGLLAKHAYSVLQVLCAFGQRLVEVRNPWGRGGEWNGAWSDNSREWKDHPEIAEDLRVVEADDGRFWMPWEAFMEVFGGHIVVCPVTLPCPNNSQMVDESARKERKVRCPQCRQPYTKSWVLLIDTDSHSRKDPASLWTRLADGKTLCFLCLRATCRASEKYLRGLRIAPGIAGLHKQTKLALAPPKGPRRIEVCKWGAFCYRRNPQHFYECFHPSLLPPAPFCESGCGRSAASGFKTCCKNCNSNPPNLVITIPGEHAEMSGSYVPSSRRERGVPVWKHSKGSGWLWKGHVWMMGLQEEKVGGTSGLIAVAGMGVIIDRSGELDFQLRQLPSPEDTGDGMPVRSPQLVSNWQDWVFSSNRG